MDAFDFIRWVDGIVHEEVIGGYPNEWFEDYLTLSILKRLRTRCRFQISLDRERPWQHYLLPRLARTALTVTWSAYKLAGQNEKRAGDIAVLVSSRHKDGDMIAGLGFMEAKKSDSAGVKFASVRRDQLSRIIKVAPRAYLLLYDWHTVCGCGTGFIFSFPATPAVVVPVDIALACRRKDRGLYKYSKPLSVQLLSYLCGFELERSKEAGEILTRLSRSNSIPGYLLHAFVGVDDDPPEQTPPPRVDGREWVPLSREFE